MLADYSQIGADRRSVISELSSSSPVHCRHLRLDISTCEGPRSGSLPYHGCFTLLDGHDSVQQQLSRRERTLQALHPPATSRTIVTPSPNPSPPSPTVSTESAHLPSRPSPFPPHRKCSFHRTPPRLSLSLPAFIFPHDTVVPESSNCGVNPPVPRLR